MSQETLNEREFELVNIIGARISANQRDLSRHLDLSLGATNMLIRRLANKGYIRISQLNKKKVNYILTPKGFSEKMRKSAKYTVKTLRSIGLIKDGLRYIMDGLYKEGAREFTVLGESDLAFLIEMVLREMNCRDGSVRYIQHMPKEKISGCLLICKEVREVPEGIADQVVDIIRKLAKYQHANHAEAMAWGEREKENV